MRIWIAVLLMTATVACGDQKLTSSPSPINATPSFDGVTGARASAMAESNQPESVRVNTNGYRLALWFNADWDVRTVTIRFFRMNGATNLWEPRGSASVAPHPVNSPSEEDFDTTFTECGHYKGELTRVDTPVSQTATILFSLHGGGCDRAPEAPRVVIPEGPPNGPPPVDPPADPPSDPPADPPGGDDDVEPCTAGPSGLRAGTMSNGRGGGQPGGPGGPGGPGQGGQGGNGGNEDPQPCHGNDDQPGRGHGPR